MSCLFLSTPSIFAADVAVSTEQSTTVENSADKTGIDKTSIYGTAKDWGLTEAEWAQYQQLMQSKSGLWYQKLQPAAVLGMAASNPEDQKHFAQIYAQQEHDKVARELAFNKAAFDAMRQLYPDEPMIRPFDTTPFNPGAHPTVVGSQKTAQH